MEKVRMTVAYDGTNYKGWQKQKQGTPTVQDELNKALSKLFAKWVGTMGSGRTDAGVHAHGQVAHFHAPEDPSKFKDFCFAVNTQLPNDIVVKEAWVAPEDFHAIRSSECKTYIYRILNTENPCSFRSRYTTWFRRPIDIEYLKEASKYFLGNQDFKSFQSSGGSVSTTVREILEANWVSVDDELQFHITGNGFLKQMVRNMVGTLVQMETNGDRPEKILEILAAKDRRAAGPTAPPEGLFLSYVKYPTDLDNKCRKL